MGLANPDRQPKISPMRRHLTNALEYPCPGDYDDG